VEDHEHGGVRGHSHDHSAAGDAVLTGGDPAARTVWLSLAGLAVTAILQLVVAIVTGSVALLADTIHNFTDALTAVPLLIAFRLGKRPPNRRYTYGYHRAEDVAGIVIVLMIAASAVAAALEALARLRHPSTVDHVWWVFAAGVVGFFGNEGVAIYRIRTGKRIGSAALVADGLHARTDGITSLGVVATAILVLAGVPRADGAVGLAITLVVVWTLVGAARTVLHRMLDGTDESTVVLIEEVAASVAGVEHVGETRARWVGHGLRTELMIDVDPALTVEAGHQIASAVREALLARVPRLQEAMVHVDPHEHASHA
jgi:cation diffusion facilitator family transporter